MDTKNSILAVFIVISIVIFSFILVRATIGEGFNINYTTDPTIFTSRSLAIINPPSNYDIKYAEKYLNMMKNFSDIEIKDLGIPDSYPMIMKVGNVNDNIKGYKINGDNFIIHLLGCDLSNLACMFRVNGVPTKRLYNPNRLFRPSSFDINSDYKMVINSIIFDYCDGARFCDLEHEAYHVVNISIVRK